MMHKQFGKWICVLSMLLAANAFGQQNRGLEIAREMAAREAGFGNYSATLTMLLTGASGRETVRELRLLNREMEGDGDQSLAVFDSPADVKGTAFLTHTHSEGDDEQWLYLPALKRVKRISPASKTSPFMGSEFTYEDLASFEVEKYTYTFVGEEDLEGIGSFVIDRVPVYDFSGYSRERVWVDSERFVALRIDFYDHRDELEKTLVADDFQLHLDAYWYPHRMTMTNFLSGKSSELLWHEFSFRGPLRDADFNPNSLTRIR